MAVARKLVLVGAALSLAAIALAARFEPSPAPATVAAALPLTPPPLVAPPAAPEPQAATAPEPADSPGETAAEPAQPIEHVVQVDRGDTLLALLVKAGVDRAEAHQAVDALREVYNPRSLKVGQAVKVVFEPAADGVGPGAFNGLVIEPDAGRQVAAQRSDQGFAASEIRRETTAQLARYQGTISSSLFEAAASAGMPIPVLVEMIRALSYDVDFQRDIRPGDSFDVMFERHVDAADGRPVRDGDVLFANLTLSGTPISIYRYVDAKANADFYNAKGESVRKPLLRTPIDGARLSSRFGKRKHPILGYNKMHKGVDFAAPTGTPIMAAGDGTVEMAGLNGAYGYYVRVRHGNEFATAYAHLSRFAKGVRQGSRIKQGQIIGYVGSTGRSTGPHLHYEILAKGVQVNPMSVKFQPGNKLAGKELQRFQTAMKKTGTMLAGTTPITKVASAETAD